MISIAQAIKREGIQEGIQQGRQEGIQQGRQEGIQQGRQEGRQHVAKNMLSNMHLDMKTVSQATGLDARDLKKL